MDLEYLFKPMPRGEITRSWGGVTDLMTMQFAVLVLLPLLWIRVNIPEMSDLVSMYLLISAVSSMIILVERVAPARIPWAVLGLNAENLGQQVIVSIILAAVTIILAGEGAYVAPPIIPTETFVRIYLWGYAFVAVEESFFTQVVLGTMIERTGIVPGSIVSALIFTAFHWNVYGWSIQILLAFFIYRVAAGILAGIYRSVIPCAFPHIIINVLAVKG